MIDREKVERALQLAEAMESSTGASVSIETDGRISVLIFQSSDISNLLKFVPRIQRKRMCREEIWGYADYEGIKIQICNVGKCEIEYVEEEVPEMLATGRTVMEKKAVYNCPDSDIVRKAKKGA